MAAWRRWRKPRGSPRHGAVGPGRRHFRQPALRRPAWHSRSRAVRHGRHQHGYLADRGRTGLAVRRRHAGRASALRCAVSISRALRPAAARSRASMPAAPCGSARRAQARCRARPATAMAARPPPSPTPMSCSAISMRAPSWAASARSTAPRRKPPIDRIAAALELSRLEAAAGIYKMINLKMADGIRLMTLRRGVDPRQFALLSFGGAAGLHAAEVARELEIKRIIVPTVASVLSAWGMLTSDLRYEVSRTHYGAGARISARRGARAVRRAGAAGRQPAARLVRRTRSRSSAPPRCATASRFLRSTCRSTISTGTRRRSGRPDRRPVPSPSRGTLHLCLARPGSGVRQRARRRGRRRVAARIRTTLPAPSAAPVRRAESGRPFSAAGAKFRSTRSTISGRAIL